MIATVPVDSFQTARLTAERLAPGHLENLARLHLDPEVSRYPGGVRLPEATRSWLDAQLAHWVECGFGIWVLRGADGAFAGRAGLRHIELDGIREIEILCSLAHTYWGRGLATEITAALTEIWRTRMASPSRDRFRREHGLTPRPAEIRLRLRTHDSLPDRKSVV